LRCLPASSAIRTGFSAAPEPSIFTHAIGKLWSDLTAIGVTASGRAEAPIWRTAAEAGNCSQARLPQVGPNAGDNRSVLAFAGQGFQIICGFDIQSVRAATRSQ
jgi:hypothetical protein